MLLHACRWHDAGTYDAETKTGGPNGSIRTTEELNRYENKGLGKAVEFCGELSSSMLDRNAFRFFRLSLTVFGYLLSTEQVKVKYPKISYADLYQVVLVLACCCCCCCVV